jgi:hypothetical protein
VRLVERNAERRRAHILKPFGEFARGSRITPDRWRIMWRAAALAVRNVVRAAVSSGAMKSSTCISASGVPWVWGCVIRLKEMSIPPASAATASACLSTACSSRASISAIWAAPPVARIASATFSSVARVRPARNTLDPSRAKARATAPLIDPPPP